MTVEQIVSFLGAINCKKIKAKDNGWVESQCPLAIWTHQKHVDHSPSFGINIAPGERSYFYCFACRSGSAEELVQVLELYAKEDHAQYNFALAHQILNNELEVMPLPGYVEFKDQKHVFVEWPAYWLDSFKHVDWFPEAMEYLKNRNVGVYTIVKHDLRFDTKRQMIVCPYFNVFGKFAGARGRSILPDVEGPKKHFDYTWQNTNNAKLVWYNERVLNLPGPVVVVEGAFDEWRVEQVFLKTVANLTAKPSLEKMKKLGDCPFIIQIPDDDKAGEESVEVYKKYCYQIGIGYKLLEIKGDGKEKLDPDKCHVDYLKDRIEELL